MKGRAVSFGRHVIALLLLLGIHVANWIPAGEAADATDTADAADTADTPVVLAPGIMVDLKRHEVLMDATVCLRRGILEFIVCRVRTFEHESVFATTCQASSLHAALLLIGSDPFPFIVDEEWPMYARERTLSCLSIEVECEQEGIWQRRPISEFLHSRERPDGIVANAWIFTGSAFYTEGGKEHYMADSSGAVIGVVSKGAAVIQFGDKSGVPYQGENQGMEVNETVTPPAGTNVRVVFSRHDREVTSQTLGHTTIGTKP